MGRMGGAAGSRTSGSRCDGAGGTLREGGRMQSMAIDCSRRQSKDRRRALMGGGFRGRAFFQWLEKMREVFPMVGKSGGGARGAFLGWGGMGPMGRMGLVGRLRRGTLKAVKTASRTLKCAGLGQALRAGNGWGRERGLPFRQGIHRETGVWAEGRFWTMVLFLSLFCGGHRGRVCA